MLILEKYSYSVYGIGFDACRSFSSTYGSGFGKNVIIFCADMNSSVHIDNKKTYILVLSKGLSDNLDHTMLTSEKEYYIIFFQINRKKFV